jgi:molybdopterin-guanine dinucleotide biosynthesis protein A
MVSFDEAADVVVAELGGRFQPMHAVYSKRCADSSRRWLNVRT